MPFPINQGFVAAPDGKQLQQEYTFVKVEKPPMHPYLPMPRSDLRQPHVTTAAEQEARWEKNKTGVPGMKELGNAKNFYDFVGAPSTRS